MNPPRAAYPLLMAPLQVGGMRLRNRIVMGAMHTRLDTLDRATERARAFYRARAEGEVALVITGGVSPDAAGRIEEGALALTADADVSWHEAIVDSLRGTETRSCMQILHAGRYAKFEDCVAPSAIRSRINRHVPRALPTAEVWALVDAFAQAARRARELGYDSVEIMGSEGYLINQFTAPATNLREDEFGGDFEGRIRFPVEIVKAVRAATAPDFPIVYRISALDLVPGGMSGEETLALAQRAEAAGANLVNVGIGWHEAPIPTIAHVVPRAGWAYAARRLREVLRVPVMASNRINDPGVAEHLLERGDADLVSMARPLLADPDFARKARLGQPERINTCIACNQSCLDRIFSDQAATCLVNPRAGRELEFDVPPPQRKRRIAVVGAGAAGMAFAFNAAMRGHRITLFEKAAELGGQLRMARNVPGKTEFDEMLRYFRVRLAQEGVELRLGREASVEELARDHDAVVVATGVRPRALSIPGADLPHVLTYPQVLLEGREVGRRVAILGAGGVGFDMAEYLLGGEPHVPPRLPDFAREYGLDLTARLPGGLAARQPEPPPRRDITLLQRAPGRMGAGLAVSTGWIRRDKLARWGVRMLTGVQYDRVDEDGLHILVGGQAELVAADTAIVCVGQESEAALVHELRSRAPALDVHVIGGAASADKLDAARAIEEGTRLAMAI